MSEKLTNAENKWRIAAKRMLIEKSGTISTVGRVTVAIEPAGSVSKMATAIASKTEETLRSSVGEYLALSRLVAGNYVLMPVYANAHTWAREIDYRN